MPRFVEIAVNVSQVNDLYTYHLPDELADDVLPGCLVTVPFGRQTVQGVVTGFVELAGLVETRPVESVLDSQPVVTPVQLALCRWLAEKTVAPLGACLALMIPTGVSQHCDMLLSRNMAISQLPEDLSPLQKRIMDALERRGDLRGRQLDALLPKLNWRAVLRPLVAKGLLRSSNILLPPRVNPKTIRTVQLASAYAAQAEPPILSRVAAVHERRNRVLQLLAADPLPVDLSWVYAQTGANYADLAAMAEAGWLRFNETAIWRDPLENVQYTPAEPPELTADQRAIWQQIKTGIDQRLSGLPARPCLLLGVTGSGKTELYMRAASAVLAAGRQVLILVPEISLTPQAVQRFLARFGSRVGIVHSRLSEGERYDTWRRARRGELDIIIGARSALFTPLPHLGLVVVDECENDSYDQQETAPYYHATDTAIALAQLAGAMVIFGSATPRITQYYQAEQGHWQLLSLPKRVLAHRDVLSHQAQQFNVSFPVVDGEGNSASLPLPPVQVVDMREELIAGNRSIFSTALQRALEQTLAAGQQAILYLNRKGTATYVFCRQCGFVVKCPNDDRPLTLHQIGQQLICHTCGYQRKLPALCPSCKSPHIRQLGLGTEKVETLFKEAFPAAQALRWDADTTRHKGAHELIMAHFSAHRADVLIGTQILAKGLDLPLVTLVGVILADSGLNLPDYRANERAFQLLTQVAGRAGRSPLGGRVIFQTYQPEHYVIQAAARHDFSGFYQQELGWRRELHYPPFSKLIRLEYRHYDALRAQTAAEGLATQLDEMIHTENIQNLGYIGAVPCFFAKTNRLYRWQVILRGTQPEKYVKKLPLKDWIVEVDPADLL